jgi:hypothetical protein
LLELFVAPGPGGAGEGGLGEDDDCVEGTMLEPSGPFTETLGMSGFVAFAALLTGGERPPFVRAPGGT